MKIDFKKLEEEDLFIARGNPTAEETKAFSEYLKARKENAAKSQSRTSHAYVRSKSKRKIRS